MRTLKLLVGAAVLAAAGGTPMSAAQACGAISMDPKCVASAKPAISVDFGGSQAPASKGRSSPRAADVQRALSDLLTRPQGAVDCPMKIVTPDPRLDFKTPVIRPDPNVQFSMRVVTVPACGGLTLRK